MLYLHIFLAFFRSGMLCWGGGPASIPFIKREAVERYGWLTDEAFGEVLAVGNALPGPINTKMSGYIGYRVGGMWGLVVAMAAAVLPTAVLMVALLGTLSHFSQESWAQGMTRGMVPVVGVMLGIMAWQFAAIAANTLGRWATVVHGAVVFPLFWFAGVHPAFVLAALFLWALAGDKVLRLFRRRGR